jgi:hypothetical protein
VHVDEEALWRSAILRRREPEKLFAIVVNVFAFVVDVSAHAASCRASREPSRRDTLWRA